MLFRSYLASEASCKAADVVSAYTLAREVFDLESIWDRIDELDGKVPASLQTRLLTQLSVIAQRASRWMLRQRGHGDLPTMIARYRPAAAQLRSHIDQWLPVEARKQWQAATAELVHAGVDAQLAEDLTVLDHLYPVLDLVEVAAKCDSPLEHAARTYFGVVHALDLGLWRTVIDQLPTETLWQTQARASARDDLYSIASQIVQGLLGESQTLEQWQEHHGKNIERVNAMRASIAGAPPDLAPVSVVLRELRQLA